MSAGLSPGNEGREGRAWDVATLVRAVADALAARFGAVTVRGELGSFTRAASGHCYFTLKAPDGSASLRCAMFRRAAGLLDFRPADGQAVEVRGRLAVYEPRGELQMVVEAMRPAGAGALMEQFLRLKARLEAEGLFDASRKRPIPAFVRRVGVVSSLAAAALHDVLTAFARRAAHVEVVVYPSAVQGLEAPPQLAAAIAEASRRAEVDLLLVCRGGGSLEDLWAFNDERVVRAIAACRLPVISGVGHETDVTLTDFVADLRAPTPTAAAELAAPVREECLEALDQCARRAALAVSRRLEAAGQRLDHAALRLARPAQALAVQRRRLDLLAQRGAQAVPVALARRTEALARLAPRLQAAAHRAIDARERQWLTWQGRLAALDPARTQARGWVRLQGEGGRVLTRVDQLAEGTTVQAVLGDGEADLRVLATRPVPPG
jgi:exodeoxyribonuclease VII large subunit